MTDRPTDAEVEAARWLVCTDDDVRFDTLSVCAQSHYDGWCEAAPPDVHPHTYAEQCAREILEAVNDG